MKNRTTVVVNGNSSVNVRNKYFVLISLLIVTVYLMVHTARTIIINNKFADEVNEFYKLNSKTVFSIDKIYMYSSASATENKVNRPVWNLNLFEYTDIAIYINSKSNDSLSNENTIKSLYIDNIKFGNPKLGEQNLYFKDINDFGKSIIKKNEESSDISLSGSLDDNSNDNSETSSEENIGQAQSSNVIDTAKNNNTSTDENLITNTRTTIKTEAIKDKLEFSILNDGDIDYSKPQLYADTSNPISLEYVNTNIKKNQIVSDISSDVIYDGSLLRKCGVVLSDISSYVSFNINIVNNYNQKFVANVYIEIPLEDTVTGDSIYNGRFVKKIEGTNLIKFFRIK